MRSDAESGLAGRDSSPRGPSRLLDLGLPIVPLFAKDGHEEVGSTAAERRAALAAELEDAARLERAYETKCEGALSPPRAPSCSPGPRRAASWGSGGAWLLDLNADDSSLLGSTDSLPSISPGVDCLPPSTRTSPRPSVRRLLMYVNKYGERVHMMLVWCSGVKNFLREHRLKFRLISAKRQLIIDL